MKRSLSGMCLFCDKYYKYPDSPKGSIALKRERKANKNLENKNDMIR